MLDYCSQWRHNRNRRHIDLHNQSLGDLKMNSLNRVQLIGNVGKVPEVRYMQNGDAVANVTIATTDTWKDKEGNRQEKTEWHRVTFYRKLAEIVDQYVNKGDPLYIEGRLETRKWTDTKGVERYTTEIIASEMKMLGGKPGKSPDHKVSEPTPETETDDIPY